MGLRLNLGSGQRVFISPWVNVDSQEKWKPDLLYDASKLEYPDGSAEVIVLHHVLEHFGCGEGQALLKNCYRMLQPGGSLLVFVPNMAALAEAWLGTGCDYPSLTDQIYMTNVYGAYMGDEADRHKWGFTARSLITELSLVAPWNVKMFDWRPIEGADMARDWWILGVEAVK